MDWLYEMQIGKLDVSFVEVIYPEGMGTDLDSVNMMIPSYKVQNSALNLVLLNIFINDFLEVIKNMLIRFIRGIVNTMEARINILQILTGLVVELNLQNEI